MVIAGAGGHALEVLDVLLRSGIPKEEILFYDDINPDRYSVYNDFIVLKDSRQLKDKLKDNPEFFLGVGNPIARSKLFDLFIKQGGMPKGILGNAIVSKYSVIDSSVDIFDFVFIGPETRIGKGSLLNTKTSVHHHSEIGEFCEISPGATLLGGVVIGDYCSIGSMAVILPGISLGSNVIIGAGSVVNKNIPDNSTALGIPARVIKQNLIP